ncbi:MAG: ABC-type phosphate/phosphonate transport system substrate-binding protein [Gammaproteobacteria bacterium]|jgi:ABC-type phosphate/phosphonate transport system substrate-binding protein/DNA-binding CsgD family transcriptional regulator
MPLSAVWQRKNLILAFLFVWHISVADETGHHSKIGVLAYNGQEQALKRWKPTADYLTEQIPSQHFEIIPMSHQEFNHAINKNQIDFILTNPGHYINLEVQFGATRIGTFESRYLNNAYTEFGSVIFTRSDSGINNYEDLRGHSLGAVSELAFGGFQLARSELMDFDLDVYSDVNLRWLGFPQTDIVHAVLSGQIDAGTVRSGILEKMSSLGKIDLADIRVLGTRQSPSFPLLHSTRLFPEWPIAKLPGTNSVIAKKVAITLLQMPEEAPPAVASSGAGWTIPLDYMQVHELFRKLKIEPYPATPVSFSELWQAYRHWVILFIVFFLSVIAVVSYGFKTISELRKKQFSLAEKGEKLETTVENRTVALNESNRMLQQDIESRLQSETTLHEGCEILQTLNTLSHRGDLTREQRLQSIIDLSCQYLGEEMACFSMLEGGKVIRSLRHSDQEESLSLLNKPLALKAIAQGGILRSENQGGWQNYVAHAINLPDGYVGVLELGSLMPQEGEANEYKNTLNSDLGMQLYQLFTQWIGNELALCLQETSLEPVYLQAKLRFSDISEREQQVLQLVSNGQSNKCIARELELSIKTIELHRSNLLRKTDASSFPQMIKFATIAGIID